MSKKIRKDKHQCIYIETFTEINIKDLILKYQSNKGNEKTENSLHHIFNLLFKNEEILDSKNEDGNWYDTEPELNLKMKISLIDEKYPKSIFLKQEIQNFQYIKSLEEKKFSYNNTDILNKEIHNFSKFMDVFVMPDDSLIIKTSSLVYYDNRIIEEDFIKNTYAFNLNSSNIYNIQNALNIIECIFKKLYKNFSLYKAEKDEFMQYAKLNIKNRMRQVSIFNIDKLSKKFVDELNIQEINYYSDILEFEQENIRIMATNYFKEKVVNNLLSKIHNNNWDFNLYYTKALAYVMWGKNYYNYCQNILVKKKLSDSFEIKDTSVETKDIPRHFISIYDINLVRQFAIIPSALSDNLKSKFTKLFEEINIYKKEKNFIIKDKKIYKKSFRESVLALWVIIGTSLLSISGLWQVATWNHDKWLPGIGENFNWFISWLILVSISGIIFISTIIYSLVKFIYSYKEFKDSKTIIKRNDENLKIIKNFYDNGIISKDIIDSFIKNILIIQKINTKNDK